MENNFKHTQGIWEINHFMNEFSIYSMGDKRCGGVCKIPYGLSKSKSLSEEQAEANAKLIASAPKLLEALQEAMQIIDRLCDEYQDLAERHANYTQGEHKRLTAAIKLATS